MDILELFKKGGLVMWPLAALSILALSVILERLWFWLRILNQEKEIVNRVLNAAEDNWDVATDIARQATDQPIGRFLYAPLRLLKIDLETFRLALEASAEDELAGMRRGEKVLEAIIALAPMLGLLGTVLGLQQSVGNLTIGQLGTDAVTNVPAGIGTALITTATGLIIAIITLVFYRLFQGLLVNQVKIFRKAGNELELLYRQSPPEFSKNRSSVPEAARESFNPPRKQGKNLFNKPPESPNVNDSLDPEP